MRTVKLVGLLLLLAIGRVSPENIVDSNSASASVQKVSLGARVVLYWTRNGTRITFGLHARTSGYIGFGIAPSGSMAGADIVLGWVANGNATLLDLHGTEVNGKPLKDTKQDWTLLYAEEIDGSTLLRFSRLLDTGDCREDVPITGNTMQVIWAFSDEDPRSEDDLTYHGLQNRGVMKLHLLENSKPPIVIATPSEMHVYAFTMPRVPVPRTRSTFYGCQVFPIDMVDRKNHVVKYSRVLDNVDIVSSIVAYACYHTTDNPALRNAGFECYSESMPAEFRACTEPIFSWSVGGEDELVLPHDAGISIGAPGDPKSIMLEIRYENSLNRGWEDKSGFRMSFTPTLRLHDAGGLVVGSTLGSSQIIPPGTSFTTHGLCLSSCLDRVLANQPNGINVFAYSLHAHSLGRSIRVRLIRDEEQIDWLGRDETYDYTFQETRFFAEPKVIKPGDHLIVECIYDSSALETTTFGGRNKSEEQCLVFLQYYPKGDLAWCTSSVPYTVQSTVVDTVAVEENGTVIKPAKYAGMLYTELLSSTNWDSGKIRRLQTMQTEQNHVLQCETDTGEAVIEAFGTHRYPSFDKTEKPNLCVGANTPRVWASLAATTTALLAASLLESFIQQ